MSSARLRCARTLWTIAERPPGSEAEVERGALEAGALRAGVDSGRRCMAALVNSRAAVCLLGQRRRKKNSGNGCCTKNCDGPWTGVGGRGRVWEGRWGLYKGPQRPPASRISSPTAARARVQPYIGLFPLDACLRPLQRGGREQGYRVPTVHTKCAPGVWLQLERSNLELNVENSQCSCGHPVSRGHAKCLMRA